MEVIKNKNDCLYIPAGAYGSLGAVFFGVATIIGLFVTDNLQKSYAVLGLICLIVTLFFVFFYILDFNRAKKEIEQLLEMRHAAEDAVEEEINFISSILSYAKQRDEYYESHYKRNVCILNKENAKHLLTFRTIINGLENRISVLNEHLSHENPKMCSIVHEIISSPLEFNNSTIYTLCEERILAIPKNEWAKKINELTAELDGVHNQYDKQVAA